ncbi:unnamed protein product [Rotaria magnacalcarata]|uniref:Uncharacterized protein n=1 Tax=Rotaria magnacalcarata TaxID=392030 RepID=A0A815YTC4_9BILA|nr:unnamed protein product [Rotaria magnacalcarata]CAF3921190.1 unnamed protein product [Rotaria magnacalcarata]CAF4699412.1 unnamed protein product [Rotaria magnacalcarata]CAF5211307.1 unnamed protein product [Rotaria magnacalcarata]
MTLSTPKSHERISIKHSTIDPVYLLHHMPESKFDSLHSSYKKQAAKSFALEQEKHNNQSLLGTSDFVNSGISRIGPSAYAPGNAMRAAYKSSPAYSFGLRHKYPELFESLGPCYFPNPRNLAKPQAPSYSLTSRRSMYKTAPFAVQYKEQ